MQGVSSPSSTGQNEEAKRKMELGRWLRNSRSQLGGRRKARPGPGGFRGSLLSGPFHHVCLSSEVYLLIRLGAT